MLTTAVVKLFISLSKKFKYSLNVRPCPYVKAFFKSNVTVLHVVKSNGSGLLMNYFFQDSSPLILSNVTAAVWAEGQTLDLY